MTPQESVAGLARFVKQAVYPHLGTWRARRVSGIASSGDATFDIDDIAENAVEEYISSTGLQVAYYSEDRGLVRPAGVTDPEGILIIDPIDGTRGAIAGLEACVVSVAWTAMSAAPRLKDVICGAITEIKGDLTFSAQRGRGVSIEREGGATVTPFLSPTTELSSMAWAMEAVGAPLDVLFQTVGELASHTTVRGGFFILNSSAFELTRLINGQLAAVVDVRNRVLKDIPATRDRFRQFGGGRLLSLYGYDVAAAALIAAEAGCTVTDAWGRSLDDWDLLDTTEANFGSLIAASNAELHAVLLGAVDAGFARHAAAMRSA